LNQIGPNVSGNSYKDL